MTRCATRCTVASLMILSAACADGRILAPEVTREAALTAMAPEAAYESLAEELKGVIWAHPESGHKYVLGGRNSRSAGVLARHGFRPVRLQPRGGVATRQGTEHTSRTAGSDVIPIIGGLAAQGESYNNIESLNPPSFTTQTGTVTHTVNLGDSAIFNTYAWLYVDDSGFTTPDYDWFSLVTARIWYENVAFPFADSWTHPGGDLDDACPNAPDGFIGLYGYGRARFTTASPQRTMQAPLFDEVPCPEEPGGGGSGDEGNDSSGPGGGGWEWLCGTVVPWNSGWWDVYVDGSYEDSIYC